MLKSKFYIFYSFISTVSLFAMESPQNISSFEDINYEDEDDDGKEESLEEGGVSQNIEEEYHPSQASSI